MKGTAATSRIHGKLLSHAYQKRYNHQPGVKAPGLLLGIGLISTPP
jgi:hypothetical protein